MQYGLDTNQESDLKDFKQRIAEQSIRSVEDRQEEIQRAKSGFIGMLAGIVVGGLVGWLFLSPAGSTDKKKELPVVRRALQPAKVQPNDPGGMEIDNQNREIYHIVDNLPKNNQKVKIIPMPEMPELINEGNFNKPSNIESLVENIENETNSMVEKDEKIVLADSDLIGIKTNSRDRIVIPQKLKEIDVKLQKSINSAPDKVVEGKKTQKIEEKVDAKAIIEKKPESAPVSKAVKGTWYTQIIASSSRTAVESLWQKLVIKHNFLKEYPHEIEAITAANGTTLYRLKVGQFKTRKEAENLNNKLKQNQISSIIKQN